MTRLELFGFNDEDEKKDQHCWWNQPKKPNQALTSTAMLSDKTRERRCKVSNRFYSRNSCRSLFDWHQSARMLIPRADSHSRWETNATNIPVFSLVQTRVETSIWSRSSKVNFSLKVILRVVFCQSCAITKEMTTQIHHVFSWGACQKQLCRTHAHLQTWRSSQGSQSNQYQSGMSETFNTPREGHDLHAKKLKHPAKSA